MFNLRTCAAKLRPLTASQTVKTISQQRPAAPRTFHPIRCYSAPVAAEPFLSGTSSNYVEEMYYAWLENPKSVHKVRSKLSGIRPPLLCVRGLRFCVGAGKCRHPRRIQLAVDVRPTALLLKAAAAPEASPLESNHPALCMRPARSSPHPGSHVDTRNGLRGNPPC